jgi:hypothetical protein
MSVADTTKIKIKLGKQESSAYFRSFSRKVSNSATASPYCHADRASTNMRQCANEPHLIGEQRTTGSSVRRQLGLVQFQIFHLRTRAIVRVVDMLGRSVRDVGDDEADIEPQLGCFDAGADAPLAFPGFGSVVCLRGASQDRCLSTSYATPPAEIRVPVNKTGLRFFSGKAGLCYRGLSTRRKTDAPPTQTIAQPSRAFQSFARRL